MFTKKILVIDDTILMQRMIKDVLEKSGYQVISASDGEEGLEKVKLEKHDLVILDVLMPGLSGFEVCSILRDNESNNLMPILMLTSKTNEEDKLRGLELGADDYIIKPFNSRELVSRVKNTLRRIDINRWANPLTGLMGNLEIQAIITQRIAREIKFTFIYVKLYNFKAVKNGYGFAWGDKAIILTADIIKDVVHEYGNSDDFVGHVGGDDFVAITTIDKCEKISQCIIDEFDNKISLLYSPEDRQSGYITTKDRRGHVMKFPIMTISIALVSNQNRSFENHLEIATVAAEVKKKVKTLKGSNYYMDKRRD